MNNNLKGELRRYFWEMKQILPYTPRQSAKLIRDLNDSIQDYVLNNPLACMEDINSEFGTPEEIAVSLACCMNPRDLKARLSFKNYAVVVLGTLLLFLLRTAMLSACVNKHKNLL